MFYQVKLQEKLKTHFSTKFRYKNPCEWSAIDWKRTAFNVVRCRTWFENEGTLISCALLLPGPRLHSNGFETNEIMLFGPADRPASLTLISHGKKMIYRNHFFLNFIKNLWSITLYKVTFFEDNIQFRDKIGDIIENVVGVLRDLNRVCCIIHNLSTHVTATVYGLVVTALDHE